MSTHKSVGQTTGALRPRRTAFDLSYRKNFTCDMGQLIPVMCDEVVPGDHLKLGNELVIRFQPLVAPIMHEISASVHYFFVPYRLLWNDWEDYISQGQLGGSSPLPIQLPVYPYTSNVDMTAVGSLWDYLGFPLPTHGISNSTPAIPVMDFPFRAYNFIYNEYYRDENLQDELPIDGTANKILNRNWRKDYFTSSLPFRQKGQAPALPVNVSLTSQANGLYPLGVFGGTQGFTSGFNASNINGQAAVSALTNGSFLPPGITYSTPASITNGSFGITYSGGARNTVSLPMGISSQGVANDLVAQSTTFDVSDLRLAFQTQKWLERNARGGTRYTEFLRSHFGVSPTDARLDRPEYIGGTKTPIQVSEVLQTSQTTTGSGGSPQGQFAGHGLAADGAYAGSYDVQEFGLVMALLSVMPKPSYQNGINRQWLRQLPTDFYFPEFSHLSEQGVYNAELYAQFGNAPTDQQLFGYVGQYDEMRIKHDLVCSEMRVLSNAADLSYWNLTRAFDSPPNLNSDFITCIPDKRIFAVPSVPGLIVNCHNLITAVRPMPGVAEPGLVDHN